jgi:hypothetical protein
LFHDREAILDGHEVDIHAAQIATLVKLPNAVLARRQVGEARTGLKFGNDIAHAIGVEFREVRRVAVE